MFTRQLFHIIKVCWPFGYILFHTVKSANMLILPCLIVLCFPHSMPLVSLSILLGQSDLFLNALTKWEGGMVTSRENRFEFGWIELLLHRLVQTHGWWSLTSGSYLVTILFVLYPNRDGFCLLVPFHASLYFSHFI